ncbi:macrophage mannose receptor 1-like [Betta splendens]|uniref:Macrophage mannose receptor 1-like n=1 Tax=Betta splendens TaxID=158456 RepID=A0A6P7L5G6_BETSP|nr:macrophage mannose receptor 1-like [Betta splendens]
MHCTIFLVLVQTLLCVATDDSPFQLNNKATGFCLVKTNNQCNEIRWTTGDRLLVPQSTRKCLGVQGKSVGSEISLYDCDENSELQKWECKNETVLALKGQELYIELNADNTAVLSKTLGPNNHLTISGTSKGACTRTFRELFSIGGNAAGLPCMFPFMYKDQWYSDCTTFDTADQQLWCAVETKYENERWGYCPTASRYTWNNHPITGAYYQLNRQAALTWPQAEVSCKQQGASLLSITDPNEQAYVTAILGEGGSKLWIGLIVDPEHGWKWTNGRPYRYIKWDSGHPLPSPGYTCAILDPATRYSWQSLSCTKKLGYICYSKSAEETPTQAAETGFCSQAWIPYNGHCFHLNRTQKTWPEAQRQCRDEGGELVSMRNLEDQSFVISQLGYESTDELWIGLNDRKTEGLFDWSDHATVSFTSWEYGKPAVATNTKDCVLIRGKNGNWADDTCESKHGFICMKMSALTPSGEEVEQDPDCKTGWRKHGSYCYFIGTNKKTFDEAKDDCEVSNSYLADVSTGVDNAFLVSLVGLRPEKYFWIGLSNQKNINEFVWTNTDKVRFTHWNAEMPGHQQGCVAMKTGIYAGLWDVLPCTNKEKYICKHKAEGAVLTPAPPTNNPPKCADGWTKLPSRNSCFKEFIGQPFKQRTWFEAKDYCVAIGGDLISIHSALDEELLQNKPSYSYRSNTVWIGLSAPDPGAGYVWSDGSPLHFQNWQTDEPNNKNNVESCTEMEVRGSRMTYEQSGSWNDIHCEVYHGWICQINAGVTPKPAPGDVTPDYNTTSDGWLEWNGAQYYINSASMAMEDARRYCQQRHGDLVTIHSEAENVFLWKQVSKNHGLYWLGLNVDLDGSSGWMNGDPVVFERWDENQPDFKHNDENCAAMTNFMGFWHDYNCGFDHKSICKRTNSPPVNATVVPTVLPTGNCPETWKKFNSKCYSIITEKETWEGARSQCKAKGGNLVSILSRHEQVFLAMEMAKAPTTDLWIGAHNKHGKFVWTDGRRMSYTNWGSYRNTIRRIHDLYWNPHVRYHMIDMDYEERHFIYSFEENRCVSMTTDTKIGIGKWVKRSSCNDTCGYVCLQNLVPSEHMSPDPTIPTGYVKIFNDSMKLVTEKMNWDAANKYCKDDGAGLASLRNEWTKTYIELMALNLQAPLWIGLNKKLTGGYFRYIDGWHMSLSNWGATEPRTDRPCVYMDVDGTWKTAYCSENKTTVCMKSTDVAPTEPSSYPGYCPEDPETSRYNRHKSTWLSFRGNCYLFITDTVSWSHASTSCVQHGASLASIEDPFEQSFIERNIKTFEDSQSSFWTGLYKTHSGKWQWLDKTVIDYSNWENGISGQGDYGMIKSSNGKWRSGTRWSEKPYICKTPKVPGTYETTTEKPRVELQPGRHHIILSAVMATLLTVIGIAILLFIFKKSGHHLTISEKFNTFDNPLFFNNERARPDLVDTNKLVANDEEENSGSVITV